MCASAMSSAKTSTRNEMQLFSAQLEGREVCTSQMSISAIISFATHTKKWWKFSQKCNSCSLFSALCHLHIITFIFSVMKTTTMLWELWILHWELEKVLIWSFFDKTFLRILFPTPSRLEVRTWREKTPI